MSDIQFQVGAIVHLNSGSPDLKVTAVPKIEAVALDWKWKVFARYRARKHGAKVASSPAAERLRARTLD